MTVSLGFVVFNDQEFFNRFFHSLGSLTTLGMLMTKTGPAVMECRGGVLGNQSKCLGCLPNYFKLFEIVVNFCQSLSDLVDCKHIFFQLF